MLFYWPRNKIASLNISVVRSHNRNRGVSSGITANLGVKRLFRVFYTSRGVAASVEYLSSALRGWAEWQAPWLAPRRRCARRVPSRSRKQCRRTVATTCLVLRTVGNCDVFLCCFKKINQATKVFTSYLTSLKESSELLVECSRAVVGTRYVTSCVCRRSEGETVYVGHILTSDRKNRWTMQIPFAPDRGTPILHTFIYRV